MKYVLDILKEKTTEDNAMKIAIVVDIYNDKGNGTSISARHFVEKLENRGHNVVVLCQGEKNGKADNVFSFKTKHIPIFQKVCEQQHALLAEPNDKLIEEALVGVDVVHIYLPFWLGTRTAEIAKGKGIPVLSCYHISAENITYNAGMRNLPFSEDMVYATLKKIHFKANLIGDIYCPSQCIAERIFKAGYTQNLHVISNGYDEKFKQIATSKPEKYKNKFVIVSVGRLTREKRQDLIVKAVAKSKFKQEIVLILAGKGAKQSEYQVLAKSLGVNIEFVFLNQDELIEVLNYADLFVQASDVETESISCLEAIACGAVPIISNAEMCATKQFALDKNSLFEHGDATSLAKKIDVWFSNVAILKAMRKNYAQLAKKYSLQKSIDSILEVYEFIVRNQGKRFGFLKNYNEPSLSFEFQNEFVQNKLGRFAKVH